MKMMKRLVSGLLLASGVMTWAACSTDENVPQQPSTGSKTAFMMNTSPTASAKSRTAGTHTGTQLDFFWTADDNLWLNNPAATPALIASSSSDIAEHVSPTSPKVATAKFWFEGTYTAPNYVVRYTGKQSTAGDKVRISPEQVQKLPAEPALIGEYGDCGTAIATRNGDHYDFTLDHKAAYITFTPFCSVGGGNVKMTQVKVTSGGLPVPAIAGTFDFTDTGINTAVTPQTPSSEITLRTLGADNTGFTVPTSPSYATNSCTMVLAPGTYSSLTVEYFVSHPISHIPSPVSKEYTNVTLTPGKNKKLAYDVPEATVSGVRYLFQDGTTGTIAEKGTRTPIAIVVVDKTATEDGLAMALKDDASGGGIAGRPYAAVKWGGPQGAPNQQFNSDVKASVTDIVADMDGYKYTWDATSSINGAGVKGSNTNMDAFYKAANHVSPAPITFSGGKRGNWILPSVGQWVLALKVLGKCSALPTNMSRQGTYATVGTFDRNYMNSLFTAPGVGGETLDNYWYWTSTQYYTLYGCSIGIDGVSGGVASQNAFTFIEDMIGDVGESVRAFIYF